MEIRRLEIDFDKRILKINGEDFSEKAIVVNLPGADGWTLSMLLNIGQSTKAPGKYDELTVLFKSLQGMDKRRIG